MTDQEIIKRSDGEPFSAKGHAENALRTKGLSDTHVVVEQESGGFVGVLGEDSASKEVKPADAPKKKTKLVRIHRASGAPENKDLEISVCLNHAKDRKKFYPGAEVELTPAEINVLRTSVEENAFYIPPDSGIYAAADPLAIARNQYPGMSAQYDQATGQIKVTKRTPNYLIEEVVNG